MSWYSDGERPSLRYLYLSGDADLDDDVEVCDDEDGSDN